ncbi:MAG: SEL1-like repeat protein [Treponema sp.]|nr:SEL1-like repeat protein [Treponema sp.]
MKKQFLFVVITLAGLFFTQALFCQETIVNEGQMLYNVAERYRLGDGVQKDLSKAIDFYKKACELDEAMAFRVLGHLYMTGTGVPKDEDTAWKYYFEAKIHGAFYEQDFAEEWAKKELQGRLPYDLKDKLKDASLEKCMQNGEKEKNDPDAGPIFSWIYYMKPARYGNAEAQYWVGKYYEQYSTSKRFVDKEKFIANARKWLTRSAAQGNQAATDLLATLPRAKGKGEMSVGQARELYSFLENIQEQKSLFAEEVDAETLKGLLTEERIKKIESVDIEKNMIVFKNSVCICVDPIRKFIYFTSYATPGKKISDQEGIFLANDWNQNKIFSIVCWEKGLFRIEYYIPFNGGIHADNLNAALDWFISIRDELIVNINML